MHAFYILCKWTGWGHVLRLPIKSCKKSEQILCSLSPSPIQLKNTVYNMNWFDHWIALLREEEEKRSCVNRTEQNKWCVCVCEFETRDNNFINLNLYWNVGAYIHGSARRSTHINVIHMHMYISEAFILLNFKIHQKWNMNAIKSKKHICFTWNCVEHVLYVISVEIEFVIRWALRIDFLM